MTFHFLSWSGHKQSRFREFITDNTIYGQSPTSPILFRSQISAGFDAFKLLLSVQTMVAKSSSHFHSLFWLLHMQGNCTRQQVVFSSWMIRIMVWMFSMHIMAVFTKDEWLSRMSSSNSYFLSQILYTLYILSDGLLFQQIFDNLEWIRRVLWLPLVLRCFMRGEERYSWYSSNRLHNILMWHQQHCVPFYDLIGERPSFHPIYLHWDIYS